MPDQPADELRAAAETLRRLATNATPGHIAAMHPGIGTALADWLDSEADHGNSIDPAALTLARRISAVGAQQPKET
jgi:hypothetical protein